MLPLSRSWLLSIWWRAETNVAIDGGAADAHRAGNVGDLRALGVQRDHPLVPGENGCVPPQTIRFLAFLPRLSGWKQYGARWCHRSCNLLDDRALMLQETVEGLAEVLHQVEAIGNLARVRCAASRSVGIESAAIPRDHAHIGECPEPGGDRVGRALGEEIDHPAAFEVAQDGTVTPSFLPRPVIHTDNPWRNGDW